MDARLTQLLGRHQLAMTEVLELGGQSDQAPLHRGVDRHVDEHEAARLRERHVGADDVGLVGEVLDEAGAVDEVVLPAIGRNRRVRDDVAQHERAAIAEGVAIRLRGIGFHVEHGDAPAGMQQDGAIELLGAEADVEHARRRGEQPERLLHRTLERGEVRRGELLDGRLGVDPLAPERFALILETVVEAPVEMVLAGRLAGEHLRPEMR